VLRGVLGRVGSPSIGSPEHLAVQIEALKATKAAFGTAPEFFFCKARLLSEADRRAIFE
jgi:hypothetical protein